MIKNLTYSVVFPVNGVKLEGKFSPQPGITAVIGPNGVGKTFTSIELTRYLLYGKSALRGSASDYKKLVAEGEFTIRGVNYTISRSSKKEQITDAVGTVLAVGADAVTKKVIELMGYGLTVFDVANASVQKQADLFGHMKPAERKRMIDEVVGITENEKVEKSCRTEASGYKREAEAMTRTLTVPEKPVKPTAYVSSEKLSEEYDKLLTIYNEAGKITATMRAEGYAPDRPAFLRVPAGQLLLLKEAQAEVQKNEYQRKVLTDSIVDDRKVPYTEKQLEAAEQRLTLNQMIENEVECPKCGDKFVPGHGHVTLPKGPDLSRNEIRTYRTMIGIVEASNEARKLLAKLPDLKDRSHEIAQAEKIEREWDTYDRELAAVEKQRAANHQAMADLKALGEVPSQEEIDYIRERLFDARYYERQLNGYERHKENFDRSSAEIAELGRLAIAFREGGEALAESRATLKALLAPSLSRVASALLAEMTHGKLYDVVVDEDMEITINGQALETLSGGGETVANIALRIALGQVLVSQTFPAFFGDEMDADADDTRREAVAEAMRSLIDEGHLKQIVLVTHRGVDIADHVIDLGNTE